MLDDANDRVYHLSVRGNRYGPLSLVELSSRKLTHDMLIWREGMSGWVPIGEVEELRPYVVHKHARQTTKPPPRAKPKFLPPPPPPPLTLPPPRSAAATTIGVLHIVFASLFLLCWPLAIIGQFVSPPNDGTPLSDVLSRPEVRYGQAASLGVAWLVAVPMLIAGIGLVRRRGWGRTLAVVVAWTGIAVQAISFVFLFVAAIMPLFGIAVEIDNPDTWLGAFGFTIGAVVGGCGSAIYDVFVLAIMSRQTVKQSLFS
jgi:hypothetical protein